MLNGVEVGPVPAGFVLPGVLHADHASASDLAGCVPPERRRHHGHDHDCDRDDDERDHERR